MSIATLKKKTASKYKNNSANLAQFSINGVHRNQGYVGQLSFGRTVLRTPAKGTESQGHGGCCGDYKTNDVQTSSINSTEDSNSIKQSVLSTSGMLAKRNRWVTRPNPYGVTKPSDSNNQSTSGDYIIYKRKNAIKASLDASCNYHVPDKCCPPTKAEIPNATKSQGEYILELISDCANLDISYIEYHTNPGSTFNTCS